MSADNYVVIFEEDDGTYRGVMAFASNDYTNDELFNKHACFLATTLDEAIDKAQDIDVLEYGYEIIRKAERDKWT